MSHPTSPPKAPRLRDVALVGGGGAVGTLARYLLGVGFPGSEHVVILGINLSGALLLGLIVSLLAGRHPRLQLLLGTGLCGGFTTYSAFAVGVAELATAALPWSALGLAIATVLGGVLATLIGVWIGGAVRRMWIDSRGVA